jgi:LmbE family N-acetylglucosaminyl deacetylase
MITFEEIFRGSRILVITPHADDETFGCAGTIARATALGMDVGVMLVSVANLEHCSSEHRNVSSNQRLAEFNAAVKCLGVTKTDVLFDDDHTHMRLDALPRRDLVAKIERESKLAIDVFKPDTLLFPAVSYNQDHEALFKAVYSTCRPHLPADKHFVRAVLAYDQPQLSWNYQPFRPTVYIDISETLDRKLEALRQHASQLRPDPHHASLENVERLARLRGSEVGVHAAEAFECHRLVM